MGLKRGKDGFRLRPDGKRLELLIEYSSPGFTPILELIKEYWEAVGVKVTLKLLSDKLRSERETSPDHGLIAWSRYTGTEIKAYTYPWSDFWDGGQLSFFPQWGRWGTLYPEGAKYTQPDDVVTYEEVKRYYEQLRKWQTTRMGSKEYMEQAEKIFDYFCTQLWCIGTVGYAPFPVIVKNNLRNVPDPTRDIDGTAAVRIGEFADQWFFKQ